MNPEGLCLGAPDMSAALRVVAAHGPPGAWIGAGFLRNAVWDALHGRTPNVAALSDLDVVFFDPRETDPARDTVWQAKLTAALPLRWSVKNQARMHARNGHPPYRDTADAIAHWPETATALAARWREGVEVLAPHGWNDLMGLILRPTPAFAERPDIIEQRASAKGWFQRWPRLSKA
jgi:uncharacterized protein